MSTGRCCRPQSWPEARPRLATPNPWRFSWQGKSGQRPSLRWYAGRAIAALPKQAGGAIPADFLLIRQEPSGLPAALLTDGTLCRLEAVADQSWQRWRCSTKAPDF